MRKLHEMKKKKKKKVVDYQFEMINIFCLKNENELEKKKLIK